MTYGVDLEQQSIIIFRGIKTSFDVHPTIFDGNINRLALPFMYVMYGPIFCQFGLFNNKKI
jgi:hypothetical protein